MASSTSRAREERSNRLKRRRLLANKGFSFGVPFESIELAQQPPHRRLQLQTIDKLGQMRFHDYLNSFDPDPNIRPWRRDRPVRAMHVRDITSRLEDTSASEYAWRMKLEELLLQPFAVESAW